jgi:hypothetical protein
MATMAKQFRREYTDEDGDVLVVAGWPVVPGIVFEVRMRGERHGNMVQLTDTEARELALALLGWTK